MRADRGIRTLRCYRRLGWLLWPHRVCGSLRRQLSCVRMAVAGSAGVMPAASARSPTDSIHRLPVAPTPRKRVGGLSGAWRPLLNLDCIEHGLLPAHPAPLGGFLRRPMLAPPREGPETGALGREAVHPLNGKFDVASRRLRVVRYRSIPPFGYARITVSWIAMQWRTRLCREETNCLSGVSIS